MKTKSQSLAVRAEVQGPGDGQRRFRRGRESCLETVSLFFIIITVASSG